jgi:uncharacterized membrane protein YeaQ/YmgE (transglycosylase-associated protein family)
MTLFELTVYLVIAILSGVVVRPISRGSMGWVLVSGLVGFVGAFLGTAIAHLIHLPGVLVANVAGRPFPIVWSIGSAMFCVIWCIAFQVLSSGRPA